MNKIKATKKEMRDNYRILSIGYCDAQHLLSYESPIAYSSNNYGWCCDYYYVKDVVISTGYDTIKSKNMKDDYSLVREYENRAEKLNSREEVQALLFELIDKLKD
jgi:hypothetical protein